MFKTKVRISTNEIKKYVEEYCRKIMLDIKKNKNQIRLNSTKISQLERNQKDKAI